MCIASILLGLLLSVQTWESGDSSEWKLLPLESIEKKTRLAKLEILASIDDNETVAEAMSLSTNEREEISRLRAKRDAMLDGVKEGDFAEERLYECWQQFAESVESLTDENDRKRLGILSLVSCEKHGYLDRKVLDFERAYLLSSIADVAPSERKKLKNATQAAFEDYRLRRQAVLKNCMNMVLETLPESSRDKFGNMVGDESIKLKRIRTNWRFDNLGTVRQLIVLELLENESICSELEFVDYQRVEFENLKVRLFNDPEREAATEAVLAYSQSGRKVPEKLAQLEEMHDKRISDLASHEIQKMLLPHQVERLQNAAVQLYLIRKNTLPFQWPELLTEELGLSESEKRELSKSTKSALDIFNEEERKIRKEAAKEMWPVIPKELQIHLETYKSMVAKELTIDRTKNSVIKLQK